MNVLFTVRCPTCSTTLRVRHESAIGQILNCPKCESMVQITAPAGWQPVLEVAVGGVALGAAEIAAAATSVSAVSKGGRGGRATSRDLGGAEPRRTAVTAGVASDGAGVAVAESSAVATAGRSVTSPAAAGRATAQASIPDVCVTPFDATSVNVAASTGGLGMRPWYGGLAVLTLVAGGWIVKDWSSRSARDQADDSRLAAAPALATQGSLGAEPGAGADSSSASIASGLEPSAVTEHDAAAELSRIGADVGIPAEPQPAGSANLDTKPLDTKPLDTTPLDAATLEGADPAGVEVAESVVLQGSANAASQGLPGEPESDNPPAEGAAATKDAESGEDGTDPGGEADPPADSAVGPDMALTDTDPAVVEIKRQLAQPLEGIEFEATPLADVLTVLEELTGLRIRLDSQDENRPPLAAGTVSLQLKATDVATVLTQALSQNGLTYWIEDSGLIVVPE